MTASPTEVAVATPTTAPPGVATMTAGGPVTVTTAPGTATMRATGAGGPDATTLPPTPEPAPAPAPVGVAPTDASPYDETPTAVPVEEAGKADPSPATPTVAASAVASTWTVEAGDHLWSIAERTLGTDGSVPSEDEVAAYWLRVIEVNRDTLVDPDHPDLIFRGQVLTLPPR
jgi:nucleoid-associated protein YgaU